MSFLFDDSNVRIFHPEIAEAVNLNAALLLQQFHYWTWLNERNAIDGCFVNGKWWMHATNQQLHKRDFKFLSVSTIKRAIADLRKLDLIEQRYEYDKNGKRKFTWYTVNRDNVTVLMTKYQNDPKSTKGQIDLKLRKNTKDQIDPDKEESNAFKEKNQSANADVDSQVGIPDKSIIDQSVAAVYNSTSSDGITPDDIALLQPYSVQQIDAALKQASLNGQIEYDGIGRKAYRIGEKPNPVGESLDDFFPRDENGKPPEHIAAVPVSEMDALCHAIAGHLDVHGTRGESLAKMCRFKKGRNWEYVAALQEALTEPLTAAGLDTFISWYKATYPNQEPPKAPDKLQSYLIAWAKQGKPKLTAYTAPLTQVERMKMELGL